MKKIIAGLICFVYLSGATGCSVFNSVFHKKEKYGCPGSVQSGQLSNDQKIAKGENVKQAKYKGGRKIY